MGVGSEREGDKNEREETENEKEKDTLNTHDAPE